jgi:hypothetical protein
MTPYRRKPAAVSADRLPNGFAVAAESKRESRPVFTGEQAKIARRSNFNAEARVQAAVVEWIHTVAPDVLVFAIPNGGLRSKTEAARAWSVALAAAAAEFVAARRRHRRRP